MTLRSSSLLYSILLAIVGNFVSDSANAAIEQVISDPSVYSGTPDTNYNDGHLYVGHLSGNGAARSYLKFQLPALTPGTQITSATLRGVHLQSHLDNNSNEPLSLYLAANDSWTNSGITWNNQPGTTGSQIATVFPSSTGILPWTYSWDITTTVNQEYLANDGFLSLVFKAENENTLNNWHYWSSLEQPNHISPFELEFTIEVIDGVVPEPTSLLVWGALALTCFSAQASRRHRND